MPARRRLRLGFARAGSPYHPDASQPGAALPNHPHPDPLPGRERESRLLTRAVRIKGEGEPLADARGSDQRGEGEPLADARGSDQGVRETQPGTVVPHRLFPVPSSLLPSGRLCSMWPTGKRSLQQSRRQMADEAPVRGLLSADDPIRCRQGYNRSTLKRTRREEKAPSPPKPACKPTSSRSTKLLSLPRKMSASWAAPFRPPVVHRWILRPEISLWPSVSGRNERATRPGSG